MKRQIVAMGGGGFSEEPENPLLDDYVLLLTGRERPKVCFVPTASGDAEGYIERFRAAFPPERAEASVLTLFRGSEIGDLSETVFRQDAIYVGGGSTANLLAVWRVHGLDEIFREAWERGVVLAGVSAGMLCWFLSGVTDSLGGEPAPLTGGLGLLPGSACPHWDTEPERRPVYRDLVANGGLPPGYAVENSAALVFRGTRLEEVVTSRPAARAFRVERTAEGPVEVGLPTRYLGGAGPG